MRYTHRMSEASKATRMRELNALGYKSDVFPAKFRGGKCGLSGLPIHVDDHVAYFRDKGLCHVAVIDNLLHAEQRAALPKCGCGRPVDNEKQGVCALCDLVCERYFDALPEDVTRDSLPLGVVRRTSCGCCTNGCVCWNHRDEPNGLRVTVCAHHQGVR